MRELPRHGRSETTDESREGGSVTKQTASAADRIPQFFEGGGIIHFGIFCCAVTMVIVLAVAIVAS
jgi:hypothetical protein